MSLRDRIFGGGDGRRPDEVVFVSSIEEDLPRRDFTMNAIADNGDQVVDTFGGIADIRQKLIRTIGKADERFQEDPIRMMRAIDGTPLASMRHSM